MLSLPLLPIDHIPKSSDTHGAPVVESGAARSPGSTVSMLFFFGPLNPESIRDCVIHDRTTANNRAIIGGCIDGTIRPGYGTPITAMSQSFEIGQGGGMVPAGGKALTAVICRLSVPLSPPG